MRRVFRIPFSRQAVARDVDDEIRFHLQTRIDALVASGMSPDDARAAALKQFGDLATVRTEMVALDRQQRVTRRRSAIIADLRQDVVYGLRTLRRGTAVTTLVIGGLALGIGANASIYSLIDAVVLRTLPVKNPSRLVIVGDPAFVDSQGHGTPNGQLYSYPLYLDVRDNTRAFTGVAAVADPDRVDARIDASSAEAEHPHGRLVSGNYFDVLRVRTAIGRTFDASVDQLGAGTEAIISYDYWIRRFHADSSIVGQTVLINGVRTAIVGVAARGFQGELVGSPTDIWLPVAMHDRYRPGQAWLRDRRMSFLLLIGRMRDGLTVDQVRAQTTPIVESSILAHARSDELADIKNRRFTIAFAPGARGLSSVRETFTAPLVALMLGVGLLLCIVCVNVANLLLARGVARRREMALRLAIGASRGRLVRQLLTESLLLALASAAAALLVSWWGTRGLVAMAADGDRIALPLGISVRLVAFTIGLSILATVLFGLLPALRASHVDSATTLRSTSRSIAGGARFGMLLIAGQVGLSLVLLVSASVVTRGLGRTQAAPLGLDRDHLIVADLDISTPNYADDRLAQFVQAARDRIAAIPGVAAVSYSANGIFSGTEWHTDIGVAGFTARTPGDSSTAADQVGAGYAKALGARIVAGRDFAPSDERVPVRSALVNESFARFYLHGANPVGRFVRFDDSSIVQIVGEIANVRGRSIDTAGVRSTARRIYIPYLHQRGRTKFGQPGSLRMLVRASGDPAAIVQSVRRAITATDRAVVIDDLSPVNQLIRYSIRDERLVARLATALGALALLLAAIGLFGVTNYSISRRTSEFGVRMALGARRWDIAWLVFSAGLRPVVVGIVIGLPLSMLAVRMLEHELNGVVSDPRSVLVALAVLLGSSVVAFLAPVRRATRIDPNAALREE